MPRKTAMLLSGTITAFVLMVVIGLVFSANQLGSIPVAQAAPANNNAANASANNSADVTALQQQVQTYKSQLQQAYSDLQQAYDQINQLQQAVQTMQAQGQGGFRSRQRGGEGFGQGQGQSSPFNSEGFFGGGDD